MAYIHQLKLANQLTIALQLTGLFLLLPIWFSYHFYSHNVQTTISVTVGLSLAINLGLNALFSWFNAINRKAWSCIRIILFSTLGCAFFTFAAYVNKTDDVKTSNAILLSLIMLVVVFLITAIFAAIKKSHSKASNRNTDNTISIAHKMFKLDTTPANYFIQLTTRSGDKLTEYLLDQGLVITDLQPSLTGGHQFKIYCKKCNQHAYAQVTNTTQVNWLRFIEQYTETKPTDMRWDIEIAICSEQESFIKQIKSAVKKQTEYQETEKANIIKPPYYQALKPLLDCLHHTIHDDVLNVGIKSINTAGNMLEINLIRRYRDNYTQLVEQTLCLWLSPNNQISASFTSINESPTVELENIELTPINLPYPKCKLTDIKILQDENTLVTGKRLYLTCTEITELTKQPNGNSTILTVELLSDSVLVSNTPQTMRETITMYQYKDKLFDNLLT